MKSFTEPLKKNGFTLIELLVVVVIIILVSSISIVSFQAANKQARDGKRQADLEQVKSALEIYYHDCGTYPPVSGAGSLVFGITTTLMGGVVACSSNTYIQQVPNDPQSPGVSYRYERPTTSTYRLCSYLETTSGSSCSCTGLCGTKTCNYSVCNP